MKPKLRAWKKHDSPEMFRDIAFIDFNKNLLGVNYKVSKLTTRLDIETLDKFILMQSTGLKDKNGAEVYEGDIVNCSSGCPHIIYWEKEIGGTFLGGMPGWYLSGLREGYAWAGSEEIIGNIYENPELLEDIK